VRACESLFGGIATEGLSEAVNPLTTVLLFQGHLFDSGLINHILDSLENATVGTIFHPLTCWGDFGFGR
jgi:hypothetical protein